MFRSPVLLALVFLFQFVSAQTPAALQKARIEGVVTSLAGEPLNKATIRLSGGPQGTAPSRQPAPVYVSSTNGNGTFVFENIEPGRYQIFAERPGYLREIYTPDPGRGPYSIDLTAGQRLPVAVKMTPQSVISGTITDEDGDPFPDAKITVYRKAYGTHKTLSPGPVATSTLDGAFSLGNLSAGRYYLAVSEPSNTPLSQRELPGQGGEEERYVTTYYPGVLEISAASLINVPVGNEVRGIHVRLRKGRVYRIAGKMITADGMPQPGSVRLMFKDLNDPLDNSHTIHTDGSFEFNRLVPGTYILLASSGPASELVGREIVTIANQDVEDMILPLGPGAEIKVTVRGEEADSHEHRELAAAIASSARYTLTPREGPRVGYMARTNDNGITVFKNVAPGQYNMRISKPAGTYIKSMRFGSLDVTNRSLDTTSGNEGTLDIVISPHAAEISGVMRNSTGEVLPGVEVTLWRPGIPLPDTLPFLLTSVTDSNGQYTFEDLPPGEYRVAGWEKIDLGMAGIPEFHNQFDQQAAVVKLNEDAHVSVDAPLIGSDAIEAQAVRFR